RKAMTYLVWSTAVISPERAREVGIVSEVVPDAQLDAAVDALCKQIMGAPRPARVGCKDYARAALDMDVAGAVEFARSIHAVINSSSQILPAGPKYEARRRCRNAMSTLMSAVCAVLSTGSSAWMKSRFTTNRCR